MDYYTRKNYRDMGVNPNQVVRWFQEACRHQWEAQRSPIWTQTWEWKASTEWEEACNKLFGSTSKTFNTLSLLRGVYSKDNISQAEQ